MATSAPAHGHRGLEDDRTRKERHGGDDPVPLLHILDEIHLRLLCPMRQRDYELNTAFRLPEQIMSREPSYPKDAPVEGQPQSEAAERAASMKAVDPRRNKQFKTGVAVGVGSAAIVAALLYANRSRKSDR